MIERVLPTVYQYKFKLRCCSLTILNKKFIQFSFLLTLALLLNGCASLLDSSKTPILYPQEVTERNQQMLAITDWKISGKIAFIHPEEKTSATINWQYLTSTSSQRLDLTTYLGINVLHLSSKDNIHTIKVDGNTFQGTNLAQLLHSLTGYTLPTDALTYWLKGLTYQKSDVIEYDQNTKLPTRLISNYQDRSWQINYSHYKNINQHQLASKITIKQQELTIKLAINQWQVY